MDKFHLQLWHVLAFLGSLLLMIVKEELTNMFKVWIFIGDHQALKGSKIQILAPKGEWKEVTIQGFAYAIPFLKDGAIHLVESDEQGTTYREAISFAMWKSLRTRHRESRG